MKKNMKKNSDRVTRNKCNREHRINSITTSGNTCRGE